MVGCGNFHAFVLTSGNDQYLHIARLSVELKSGENHFDLSKENLLVEYARFDGNVSKILCNDIRLDSSPKELERFNSISGSCIVTLTEENFKLYQQGKPYEMNFVLNDVKFENGIEVNYHGNVIVGWMPG